LFCAAAGIVVRGTISRGLLTDVEAGSYPRQPF
jgi:hypothetical protein